MNCLSIDRPRREWVYISTPTEMDMGPCPRCGGREFRWSTFNSFVWCDRCNDDVKPEHYGVIDGPVMVECCKMLGISFDAFDLLTCTVVPFDSPLWPNKHLKP